MASIRENRNKGKVVSYTFTACLGRDENGKQIRRYKNWTPPKGVGPVKAPKEAEKQAALWEESLKPKVEERTTHAPLTTVERQDDFVSFIEKVWFPLQVSGNDRKEKTIQFYESTTKIIKASLAAFSLFAYIVDRVFEILERDLVLYVRRILRALPHSFVDSANVVQNRFIGSANSVSQESIKSDLRFLMITDELSDGRSKSVALPLREKAGRVNTLT